MGTEGAVWWAALNTRGGGPPANANHVNVVQARDRASQHNVATVLIPAQQRLGGIRAVFLVDGPLHRASNRTTLAK